MKGQISSRAFLYQAVGDDFKELRPIAAMRQGDALTPETHSVLSRYSHFALGKDGPLCQRTWHSAQGKNSSLDTAGTEKLWALTFPVLFVVARQTFANPLSTPPRVTWRAAAAPPSPWEGHCLQPMDEIWVLELFDCWKAL